jgi:hypothetical protein
VQDHTSALLNAMLAAGDDDSSSSGGGGMGAAAAAAAAGGRPLPGGGGGFGGLGRAGGGRKGVGARPGALLRDVEEGPDTSYHQSTNSLAAKLTELNRRLLAVSGDDVGRLLKREFFYLLHSHGDAGTCTLYR